MGLKRLVKKAGKVVKKSIKAQVKVATAPLKFAKKNPALTAGIVGAVATGGGTGLLSFGKSLLSKKLEAYGIKTGEQVGEGVAYGGYDLPAPTGLDAPVSDGSGEFASPMPKGLLIAGAALVGVLLLTRSK